VQAAAQQLAVHRIPAPNGAPGPAATAPGPAAPAAPGRRRWRA